MSRLIVNADDFGLTAGVNRGIMELAAAGVVTSTTLMARAGATDEAIELARAAMARSELAGSAMADSALAGSALACSGPSLGVGCHVVLVDGEPVLAPARIPTLVAAGTGRFHSTLGAFLTRLFAGRIRADEIEAEAGAQMGLLQSRGVRLTHIDTHKHTHLFPAVLKPLLRAARAAGIGAIRNPFEPAWCARATPRAPRLRSLEVRLLRGLEPAVRRILNEHEFATTDGTLGVLATGTLDAEALSALLQRLPDGTWEMVTHPGYNDADLARVRTRLRASREHELNALRSAGRSAGTEYISFGSLRFASLRRGPSIQRQD